MADGIYCKNCGWPEADHDDGGFISDDEFTTPKEGYKMSLQKCSFNGTDCPGYEPEDPELAKKLAENHVVKGKKIDSAGD